MNSIYDIVKDLAFTKCADAFLPFGEEKYGSRNKNLSKSARTGASR